VLARAGACSLPLHHLRDDERGRPGEWRTRGSRALAFPWPWARRERDRDRRRRLPCRGTTDGRAASARISSRFLHQATRRRRQSRFYLEENQVHLEPVGVHLRGDYRCAALSSRTVTCENGWCAYEQALRPQLLADTAQAVREWSLLPC
jgi:hypothetical protein